MAGFTGTVKIGGVGAQATVTVYAVSPILVAETKLTNGDGTYSFTGLDINSEYYISITQLVGAVWQDLTVYTAGDLVRSSVPNGFVYQYTANGTSAATPPVWPTVINDIIADGDTFVKAKGYTLRPRMRGPFFPV